MKFIFEVGEKEQNVLMRFEVPLSQELITSFLKSK